MKHMNSSGKVIRICIYSQTILAEIETQSSLVRLSRKQTTALGCTSVRLMSSSINSPIYRKKGAG